jgi:hypothetical protein
MLWNEGLRIFLLGKILRGRFCDFVDVVNLAKALYSFIWKLIEVLRIIDWALRILLHLVDLY